MENEVLIDDSKKKSLALILLILTTILWGSSFIITRTIVQTTPIFLYIGLRFSFALIGFSPFLIYIKKLNKKTIIAGFLTGILYFLGMLTQTTGLQTTTAGKAGFITGLNTIFTPIFMLVIFKKSIKKKIWIAAIISIIGLAFLFIEGLSGIIIGDLWVLICAVFFALFIVYNDKYVKSVNVYLYSIFQLLTIVSLSFTSSFIFQEKYTTVNFDIFFWTILGYMGIIVTSLTFLFQNWSQQYQGASTTAIIFALEPVFAALFGYLIGNEIFTIFGWIGSILIFIAILITVLKKPNNKEK